MAEIITKDCKEYHIWDKVNGVWNRLFFKTNAKSVEADDGKDLQTKVGAINGISSSSTATATDIAASIGYVNQINTNLTADGTPFRFGKDSDGNYGYIITDEAGADSVVPFRRGSCVINGTVTYTSSLGVKGLSVNNIGFNYAKLTQTGTSNSSAYLFSNLSIGSVNDISNIDTITIILSSSVKDVYVNYKLELYN